MTTSTRRRRKSTSSPERHGRDGGRGADHASPARGTGCRLRWLLTTTPSPPAPWSRISRRIDSSLLLAFWLGPFHQHQHLARAGQRGAGRHTAGLCQRQQGRLGHLAALGRLRHERRGFDAGRRADPVLHRPGPAPAPAAVPYRLAGCRRTVSALLHAARQERKAALYPGRVDTTLPRLFECSPTVNVDRPKPCHFRAAQHTPPDPGPAPVPVRSPTVEQLLKRKILRRLRGRTSAFWAAPPATRGSRWSSSPPSRSRSRRRGVRGGRRTAPQCRPGLAAGGSHFSLGCRPCGPGYPPPGPSHCLAGGAPGCWPLSSSTAGRTRVGSSGAFVDAAVNSTSPTWSAPGGSPAPRHRGLRGRVLLAPGRGPAS